MPAKPKSEFVEYLLELLEPVGNVHARAMFGGYGLFHNGIMFALVADDVLYFKADDTNKKHFEERELDQFEYYKKGKTFHMSYYEAPGEVLDDADEMSRWANSSIRVAINAAQKKTRKRKPEVK